MFGFGKLVKRHKLSVAEEAELRKWSYNTASFVKDYYRYCESKNIPTIACGKVGTLRTIIQMAYDRAFLIRVMTSS